MLSAQLPVLLDELEGRIAEIRRINALDVPEPLYKSVITQLADVRDLAGNVAVGLAITGVNEQAISRRAASDRLRMHPNTLERWITRFEEAYTGPDGTKRPLDTKVIENLG